MISRKKKPKTRPSHAAARFGPTQATPLDPFRTEWTTRSGANRTTILLWVLGLPMSLLLVFLVYSNYAG